MATQELKGAYARTRTGEGSGLPLTVQTFGPPQCGVTMFAPPASGIIVFDLSRKQTELLARIVSFRYLAPAPVKPMFRGRRHGW